MKYEVLERLKEGDTWKIVVKWNPNRLERFLFRYKNETVTYIGDFNYGFYRLNNKVGFVPKSNFFVLVCG